LRERQDWAAGVLREWYLFPETLPANLDPTGYGTVQDYIDALTATARSQGKDRGFTYLTSIAEENAFYQSGASAGFGFRLSVNTAQSRLFIAEAYENTPALAAGIDRGAEILAIGTSADNLRTVSSILSAEGSAGLTAAFGPSDPGVTRVIRFRNAAGTESTVTVTKADFSITPVSSRYGARIIEDAGRRVGYINLRTFIDTADPALRQAFANFRAQGITEVIVDVRYNGGGLVRVAELLSNLLGGQRTSADVMTRTTFRESKSSNNDVEYFSPQPQSIAATKIAFIGTRSSASASEMVMNNFIPYLGASAALIGTNTFGKPVGQIAIDRAACDDRLRVVAFRTENRDRQGDYYNGLAPFMGATCQATDDLSRPLGDPAESSIRAALDFLAGRSCTPITSSVTTQSATSNRRDLLAGESSSTVQREVPGTF
jgi:C-terminal processing protease CtpA/Prc